MEKMDNILKLLLGVLGVAGLLAMLVPSDFTPTEPEPTVAEAPPPEPVENAPVPEEPMMSAGEEYNFTIGEPTIDGKPIVDPDSPMPANENVEAPPAQPPIGAVTSPAQPSFAPSQNNSREAVVPAI